eukprot:702344-Amphidinium_carterae.1
MDATRRSGESSARFLLDKPNISRYTNWAVGYILASKLWLSTLESPQGRSHKHCSLSEVGTQLRPHLLQVEQEPPMHLTFPFQAEHCHKSGEKSPLHVSTTHSRHADAGCATVVSLANLKHA